MVNIRVATQQDIPMIRQIATMAWHDTYQNIRAASTIAQFLTAAYNVERLEKRIKESLFIVAEKDNKVVGFSNFINGHKLYLSSIYVMPGFQRQQVGKDLLNYGVKKLPDYEEVFVESAIDNIGATNFYKKNGFEIVRTYEEEIFGETVTTGLLKKSI